MHKHKTHTPESGRVVASAVSEVVHAGWLCKEERQVSYMVMGTYFETL
jgi:hypothetical protein